MPESKPGTKRKLVDKDKTKIFVIVSAASVIVIGSLVASSRLWSQGNYLSKVADKKEDALEQLEENKEAVDTLKAEYDKFAQQNPNLIGGQLNGTSEKDGDNGKLILDALPSKYDLPALVTSLERMLAGFTIKAITAPDDSINQQANTTVSPVEMPFTIEVESSYETFKGLMDTFDRSIRPIHLTRIEFTGTNNALKSTISAKTYYQPERGLQITEEEVQ